MARLIEFDNLDDRREVFTLVHTLPPAERVRLLAHFCERARAGGWLGARPKRSVMGPLVKAARRCDNADRALSNVVWSDLWLLVSQYQMDPAAVTRDLERIVRKPSAGV